MKLWRCAGWGSAIVEAQAAAYGLPLELVEAGDLFENAAARAALARVNPLVQLPTLLLDDGRVMTESAAITLHLADLTGSDLLVPGAAAVERAAFLRWLIFMVANIYPCFTFADDPARFVDDPEAAADFKARVDEHGKRLWRMVEAAAGGPWFLGDRFSAVDVYVAVMSHWRPGRDWFAAEAPKLTAIARAVEARADMGAVLAANFPA